MKLHSGNLAWSHTNHPISAYPSLRQHLSCDCLIIGGGIGGALCAHLLADSHMDTVLIDKRTIASGSTLANTGLIQFSNDKTLTSMINTFGEKPAVRFYKMCQGAVGKLIRISQNLQQEARITPRNSLYLASSEADLSMLREEFTTLCRHHFPVEWWDRNMIAERFPFQKSGAIYSYCDGEGNPFAFVHGLIQAAAANGVSIFEQTEASGFKFLKDGVLCRAGDYTIRAKHVIFSAGYETQQFHKEKGAHLTSSFVMVTEPADHFDDWFERCLIWETARPYLYMRTTPDQRIMIGGLDEPLENDRLDEARHLHQGQVLLEKLHQLFPEKKHLQAAYAYGAVFGESRDGLPYIGPHPDYPHCYFLKGLGGNGAVYSMIAAEMITDVLTGKQRRDMDWFSLTRTSKPTPAVHRSNME
ncbi:NAD(P)/FAD-dependent oxidoreductase [Paenibacillus fonticola]|uniref:NAD(P)/FAD-dependent oxidoreductase n=1 Tax=Paenibacillus fonticola TaxID=379896 RepID=UPI0003787F14|nr:FAD-dependent oxidoreductase [Paenibacillus fonticola]